MGYDRTKNAHSAVAGSMLLAALWILGGTAALAAGHEPETIVANATVNGSSVGVTLVIFDYSTAAEKQILSAAFAQGQDQGLVAALSKLKPVGHCSISGSLGYDVAFIQMDETPTGRKITIVTSHPLPFDQTNPDGQAQTFSLTVGELNLNDNDKTMSTGFLFSESKLVVDKRGQFHYDLGVSPWNLVSFSDSRESSGGN